MAGTVDDRVHAALAELTLEQKVGQLFVTCIFGADATRPSADDEARNLGAFGLPTPADVVGKFHLGGIVYYGWANNTEHPEQVAQLSNGLQQAAAEGGAGIPLLVAAGEQRESVGATCPAGTDLPTPMALGAAGSDRDAYQAARVAGRELRAVGVNQTHAPSVDVAANPRNPVLGIRAHGADPELVTRLSTAQVRGYLDAGVLSTAKHFPGRGDTALNTKVGMPFIVRDRDVWAKTDLPPLRAVVTEGVDAVLVSHVVVPALDDTRYPATLSAPLVTGVLREWFAFDGLVVADSLRMRGVRAAYGDAALPVLALQAGVDQLLVPPNLDLAVGAVLDAVRDGELSEERVDESVSRILRKKHGLGLLDRPYVDAIAAPQVAGSVGNAEAAAQIANRTVTVVRDDGAMLPLDPAWQAVLVVGAGSGAAQQVADELGCYVSWSVGQDVGLSPDTEAIKSAVARARHHDVVVVLTKRAWDTTTADPAGGQRKLLAALFEASAQVVVVATGDPHDLVYADGAPATLATYGDGAASMCALARVLVGAVEPRGTLPVSLPRSAARARAGVASLPPP